MRFEVASVHDIPDSGIRGVTGIMIDKNATDRTAGELPSLASYAGRFSLLPFRQDLPYDDRHGV
jgi:hypothetical protein